MFETKTNKLLRIGDNIVNLTEVQHIKFDNSTFQVLIFYRHAAGPVRISDNGSKQVFKAISSALGFSCSEEVANEG